MAASPTHTPKRHEEQICVVLSPGRQPKVKQPGYKLGISALGLPVQLPLKSCLREVQKIVIKKILKCTLKAVWPHRSVDRP